jgi:hypothetical protein
MTPSHSINKKGNYEGTGTIVNAEGIRDTNSIGKKNDQTWGKRSNWVDYFAKKDGKVYGIAIFDHPKNPRHPTWWHVRSYALFAANPFGQHDFEKLDDVLDLAAVLLLLALRTADPVQHAGDEIVSHQVVAADHDVVEHRHVAEQGKILERTSDAESSAVVDRAAGERVALVEQLALGRAVVARDAIEHRGLAGPVRTDDREHLTLLDVEAYIGQCAHTAELDRYVRHSQNVLGGAHEGRSEHRFARLNARTSRHIVKSYHNPEATISRESRGMLGLSSTDWPA